MNSNTKLVLFFNSNKAWGGGEKWHFEMACALRKLGVSCQFITNKTSVLADRAEAEGFTIKRLGVGNLTFLNIFKLIHLFFFLKQSKSRNIIMNLPSDVKFCAPIARLAGVKKVIYRRGMPNVLRKNFINRIAFNSVDVFIANSEEIKRTIVQNFKEFEDKVKIIFNGVIPRENSSHLFRDKLIIGNLGRLVEQKGQKHLIEIAKYLRAMSINFEIRIAGVGPLESELISLVTKENLEDYISFVGHVKAEKFLTEIDIFAFTSYFEGSANALIESLQFEVPAIAFDISSNPEVVEDKLNGFLIKPFNEEDFAKAIVKLWKNKDLYRKFQKASAETIKSKFDYDSKVLEVKSLLVL